MRPFGPMRRLLLVLGLFGLVGVLAIGLAQAGGGEEADPVSPPSAGITPAEMRAELAGAPAELAALHEQAGELLPGGTDAFAARLRELRGRPVVVNKWASWCGPCRLEFPSFQEEATARGREVAFVGINAGDQRAAAARFLKRYPVPFPSYEDPDEAIARSVGAPANYPITVFYDRRGRRAYIHQGGYRDREQLTRDIERYALGS
jgi:cytochrome c biogenesis protein CcmG, thiol:disulfide interchange protein DsbE